MTRTFEFESLRRMATRLLLLVWLLAHSIFCDSRLDSHVVIQVNGHDIYIDPCSLQPRPEGRASAVMCVKQKRKIHSCERTICRTGSLIIVYAQAQEMPLQSCFRFATRPQNGSSASLHACSLLRLPRGVVALHDSATVPCNPSWSVT